MNDRDRKIVTLTGIATSPKAFCGMLLEHSDDIEHIACVIQWKRDAKGEPSTLTNVAATQMTLIQAAWLKWVFNKGWPLEDLNEQPSFQPDDSA
jgi:hypothetical protein